MAFSPVSIDIKVRRGKFNCHKFSLWIVDTKAIPKRWRLFTKFARMNTLATALEQTPVRRVLIWHASSSWIYDRPCKDRRDTRRAFLRCVSCNDAESLLCPWTPSDTQGTCTSWSKSSCRTDWGHQRVSKVVEHPWKVMGLTSRECHYKMERFALQILRENLQRHRFWFVFSVNHRDHRSWK